jgi:aminoglycoside 3-N-acetyltransferase
MNSVQYSNQLKKQLLELGIREGGILFLYASIDTLGFQENDAEMVMKMIFSVLGKEGTLLMPAATQKSLEKEDEKVFSAKDTPTDSGFFAEFFRKQPNVVRSVHPTHSVCGYGPYAKELLERHKLDQTPFGPNSPYALLSQIGGQILFLGADINTNFSIHAVEEKCKVTQALEDVREYRIFDNTREKSYTKTQTCIFDSQRLIPQKRAHHKITTILKPPAIKKGKVLESESYLMDARALWSGVSAKLQEDPTYFMQVSTH